MKISTTTKSRVQAAPKRKSQRQAKIISTTTTRTYRSRRRGGSRFRYVPSAVPAAYRAGSLGNYFYTRATRDGMIVYGRSFVKTAAEHLDSPENPNVIFACPVNPVYWQGTTISTLASAYNNYRPLKLKINYEPTVGTATDGLIVFGTTWGRVNAPADTLINVLKESNGGFSTQPYRRFSRSISLGRNLSQNSFYIAGNLQSQSTNPFMMIAMSTTDKVSGEFWIEYTYKLSNVGNRNNYNSYGSKLIEYDGTALKIGTQTIAGTDVAFVPSKTLSVAGHVFGPGTVLDVQLSDGKLSWKGESFFPADSSSTWGHYGFLYVASSG